MSTQSLRYSDVNGSVITALHLKAVGVPCVQNERRFIQDIALSSGYADGVATESADAISVVIAGRRHESCHVRCGGLDRHAGRVSGAPIPPSQYRFALIPGSG